MFLENNKRIYNGRDLVLLYKARFENFIKPDGLFEKYCRDSFKDYRLGIDKLQWHCDRNGISRLIASYLAERIALSDLKIEILITMPVLTKDEYERYPKDYSRCKQLVKNEFEKQIKEKFS